MSLPNIFKNFSGDNQAEEYFDFGQALENLGKVVLPFAKKLQEEC